MRFKKIFALFIAVLLIAVLTGCGGNTSSDDNYTDGDYRLIIEINGEGTVTKTPDLPLYEENTAVRLEANPADGWTFGYYSCGNKTSKEVFYLIVDFDYVVAANFAQIQAFDDFSDPNSGWSEINDIDYSLGYSGEGYQINIQNQDWVAFAFPPLEEIAQEYVVKTEIDIEEGGAAGGFIFNCLVDQNYYLTDFFFFEFDETEYRIFKFVEHDVNTIDDDEWTLFESGTIDIDNYYYGFNEITMVKHADGVYDFFINGDHITEFTVDITDSPVFGLIGDNRTFDPVNINFDNFIYATPATAGTLSSMSANRVEFSEPVVVKKKKH